MSATAGCRDKGSSPARGPGQGPWATGSKPAGASRPARLRHDVRKKSLAKLKDKIREKTRRNRGDSLAFVIADLNRTLRGWFGYFKQAYPTTFKDIDGFIRRRLRALLLKQDKRVAFGFSIEINKRWPNAYFANAGLFALHAAWQSARQSR